MGERVSIGSWWRGLLKSNQELDAEELLAESAETGADPVQEIHRGELAHVRGVIKSVILRPEGSTPVFQADVFDGSGTILVSWLGRRAVRGVTPARHIDVRGRVTESDGRRTICNPEYQLIG